MLKRSTQNTQLQHPVLPPEIKIEEDDSPLLKVDVVE